MMSINLAHLFALVKTKFQDFDVLYDTPPSFLKTVTNKNEKVIFICKIPNYKLFPSCTSPIKVIEIEKSGNLDLTGSPLKDDCGIEALNFSIDLNLKTFAPWSKDEEKFQPIDLEKVRAMLSDQVLQQEGRKTSSFGSIWFLCKPTRQDNTILMSLNFENGFNSINFIKYHNLIEANSINCENLMSTHYSFLRDIHQTETFIENCYYIKPNIFLKLNWSTSATRPNLINIKNCDTVLCQNIDVADNDSDFWRQLSILSLINEDIGNFKTNDQIGNEIVYKWGRHILNSIILRAMITYSHAVCFKKLLSFSGIETDILKEKIINAMTELSSYCCNNENDVNEIEAVIVRAKNRSLTDITDKLWEILKCCSSYRDLKLGFTQVFQCAAQRNIINMPINENSLAKIIREVAQRRLAIPCLTGTEPLELLLEIGLEKLQKDYEYIVTESKLCGLTDLHRLQNRDEHNVKDEQNFNIRTTILNAKSQNQIKKNRKTLLHNLQNTRSNDEEIETIGFQNSKYNEKETELKLAKLCQIHIALEHLLSIQNNLNLKNVYNQMFEQLLQRQLQPFPPSMNKCSDSIKLHILTDKITGHVENKNPHVRRIVISSSNKFKQVESTFYYNMENIYPSNIFNSAFDVLEEKPENKTEYYFLSTYVCIKSRRT